ncbi:MAG TPA: methylmalonyl Co-A mutase-associated GTPase MeaB [Actinobacteria bacterium]|nr:methylmalonyl Co-A mutase-associated GTPase MeaB [Actinomycetota bacterium]
MAQDSIEIVTAARKGDRRALARLISIVEEHRPAASAVLAELFPSTGKANVVGLTGAPGSGKSTLSDVIISRMRSRGDHVAVIAVDPSSPFTGGAILGDRIRMQDHITDPGVYIRSMGSRGHLGGMSAAAPKVVTVLDGIGFPQILIETVGVGQAEVEVVGEADTTVVVVNPGWGDAVQANKAGLLEIADVFVVNKADRPGVRETVRDLNQMLDLGSAREWRPPIIETVATKAEGSGDLMSALDNHRAHLVDDGHLETKRSQRLEATLKSALALAAVERMANGQESDGYQQTLSKVTERRLDPWSAAQSLVEGLNG